MDKDSVGNEMQDYISRLKIDFFQNMSHDFKTPLTVISTSLLNVMDMLEFGELCTVEAQGCLEGAQAAVMRLARMVDGMARIASSLEDSQSMRAIDVNDLTCELSKTYFVLLQSKNNNFIIDVPKKFPYVYGSADMLIHVMVNLIANANRHTKDGEIIIKAEKLNGEVVVTIQDDGSGIAPDFLPHIFERGVTQGGTGFGLAICKDVIEGVHGGKIWAASEVGLGTTVGFSLPIYLDDE